jgi:hypothetical protein
MLQPRPQHNSVLRLIGDFDDPGETLGCSQLEFQSLAFAEEWFALADNDRVDGEFEHIEKALVQQRLTEQTVSQNENVTAVLLLELGHLRCDLASNNGRVIPIGGLQLGRKHVFLYRK